MNTTTVAMVGFTVPSGILIAIGAVMVVLVTILLIISYIVIKEYLDQRTDPDRQLLSEVKELRREVEQGKERRRRIESKSKAGTLQVGKEYVEGPTTGQFGWSGAERILPSRLRDWRENASGKRSAKRGPKANPARDYSQD